MNKARNQKAKAQIKAIDKASLAAIKAETTSTEIENIVPKQNQAQPNSQKKKAKINKQARPPRFMNVDLDDFTNIDFNLHKNQDLPTGIQQIRANNVTFTRDPKTPYSSQTPMPTSEIKVKALMTCQLTTSEIFRLKQASFKYEKLERKINFFNKVHLLVKHEQLYPSTDQLNAIQTLVERVEQKLKDISDKLCNEARIEHVKACDVAIDDQNNDEQYKLLKGVVRVGLLSRGILMKTDKDLHLVMLCTKKPTISLLKRVASELNSVLNTNEYKILTSLMNSCLIIQNSGYNVVLGFTSREYETDDENKIDYTKLRVNTMLVNPVEALPSDKCLDFLTEIRRTKWFHARLLPVSNSLLIMRVLRDLCARNATWSVLNRWTLELIVDKCFIRAPYASIGFKFRTVMEFIANGFFLPPLSEIYALDTCEKAQTCVVDYLSLQQREDITRDAQQILRLIAFKQIHKVLNITQINMQEHFQQKKDQQKAANTATTVPQIKNV